MNNYPRSPIPDVALVRHKSSQEQILDVAGQVQKELERVNFAERIAPGSRVAITAGSRGISNIALILKTIVQQIQRAGAFPFIVPAMGSHGGASAEGQLELLSEYEVTPEHMGVPILSDMRTVELGTTPHGAIVHMDAQAYAADAIIVVGRVKAHTAVKGPIQSGLCKMIAIGLGKQRGAESMHQKGLAENIPDAAKLAIRTGKIALGVAIVENAFHQTHSITAVEPSKILETEQELLRVANKLSLQLPFDRLDVLVVDWIGKNLASAGMDMNVIGLWRVTQQPPFVPMYKRIVALRVTPESHGNCLGIGRADFTTRELVSQYDAEKVYWNALVANGPDAGKIPIALDTEVDAVEVALRSARPEGAPFDLVRIQDTSNLTEFYVTANLLDQLRDNPEFEIVCELASMPRGDDGKLLWHSNGHKE